jgi:hypothetical protein
LVVRGTRIEGLEARPSVRMTLNRRMHLTILQSLYLLSTT